MFGSTEGLRRVMSQDNIKPRNTRQTLGRLLGYFKAYTPVLLVVAALLIGTTWAQVRIPELIGNTVDCFLAGPPADAAGAAAAPPAALSSLLGQIGQSSAQRCAEVANPAALTTADRLAGLGRNALIILALYVFISLGTGLQFFLTTWAGQHVLRNIRKELFSHLHRLSMGFHTEHEAGDLMSRITNDSEVISQALNFALIQVLGGVLLLGWVAVQMLRLSVPYALISLVAVPAMLVATLWLSNQARKAFRKARQDLGNVNAELQEGISAVREVQAFGREEENIQQFMATNAANRDANIKAVSYTSALAPTLEALGFAALALVAAVGGLALLRNQPLFGTAVSLGLVITFITYVQRFNQPIQQIAILWTNVQNAIAGMERIFNLLDEVPTVQDAPNAQEMPPIRGEVEFRDVHAEYKEGVSVLHGVSFKAEPGQTVAIVGPTGAGKTTIINLIPRFWDVTDGQVLIDGIDVRTVTQESLRRQIGIVLQEPSLFSATIKENIRFGRPEATDEEVLAAAKLARVDSFVERLPDGYDTVLGERGSGLSQGQRQLIAIARAALVDPRILILDEATASVDTRTERLIQAALEQLLAGRTSFVIAHRLSTIRNADVVLVLDKGRIVEQGTHEELLARRGFYYNLYMSQFRRQAAMMGVPSAPAAAPGGNGYQARELARA
ncbi:MAG: ABC transporter ATP-binding protein/permease [Caldilineales bacterium]|nr:ABC transporter ATP-binding protein/permease [Caldilineales bacterium]MDW8316537.1 ABC transporter ATP-binding protein [Anaerolineae bacterium]